MSRVLQLEAFLRAPPPSSPEPMFDAAAVSAARAQGHAAGYAAAQDEAGACLAASVDGLAAALSDLDGLRTRMMLASSRELFELATVLVSALAAPTRAESLCAAVLAALQAETDLSAAFAPRIRCEAGSAGMLRAALDRAGLARITIDVGGTGAEFSLPDGLLRIDRDRVVDRLNNIIADFGTGDEEEAE